MSDTTYRTLSGLKTKNSAALYAAAKRILDVSVALIALFILAPVMLLAAIAIARECRGPVLYKQTRTGLHGREFHIYKFRTMSVMEHGEIATQCRANDPRVTPIGRYLRKLSIDELPQLVNVLMGDMSLVGPRPHPPALDKAFAPIIPGYMERYYAKPGMTGLAQILGYRGPTLDSGLMERRVRADAEYVRQRSLLLDLWIVIKTIPVVLVGQNAV